MIKKDIFGENAKKIFKAVDKYKYLLIVIFVGILLIALPIGGKGTGENSKNADDADIYAYELSEIEARLEEALSRIDGVGDVKVILTLKTGTERILATDRSSSYKAGDTGEVSEYDTDESTVVISSGSGIQEAVVVKTLYPEYQGALIVCRGGGNSTVCLTVTEAVSALTGLGSDKIKVTKMR
ncbi:MAG: stage III sporulation protein AG [Oscillospiraceae bacterium]|jgi:stage III sporulation protein AG